MQQKACLNKQVCHRYCKASHMCTRGLSPFESQIPELMKDCSRLLHREPQKPQTLLNPTYETCQQLQPVLCFLALQPPPADRASASWRHWLQTKVTAAAAARLQHRDACKA